MEKNIDLKNASSLLSDARYDFLSLMALIKAVKPLIGNCDAGPEEPDISLLVSLAEDIGTGILIQLDNLEGVI